MILPTTTTASVYGSMDTSLATSSHWMATGPSSYLLNDWPESIMLVSTLFNCMSAGMMFIFSNTIMRALAKLSDESGIVAMVTINDVILNPLFKLLFTGGLVSAVPMIEMLFIHPQRYSNPARLYVTLATVVYFFGQIVITVSQNIPRNDALMRLALDDMSTAYDYWRNEYLPQWTSWNTARAVCSTLASVFGMFALYFMGK